MPTIEIKRPGRIEQIAHASFYMAASALLAVLAVQAGRWLPVLARHADKSLSGIDGTIANINRPCAGPAGPAACGTLAQINKTTIKIGDAVVTTQIQVRNSQKLMDAASASLDRASASLASTATHANAVLDQTRADLQTANGTLGDADKAITGLAPVEESATQAATRIRDLAGDPNISRTMANLATVTGNFGDMTHDANLKFHDLLFPPPCRGLKCHIGQTINDVRIGASFIEPAFYLRELIAGQAVSGSLNVVVKQQPK